ncbi:MAG: hypothetical protein Ct9H300mP15_26490 [Gemmatimonadota bacterium]|nr:MAG: hypothetical protein Ct9H300mP15_26490 [Gemmatimonadota bacterium]
MVYPKTIRSGTVREDPEHEGFLFAGTEFGVFVTLKRWQHLAKFSEEPAYNTRDRERGSPMMI